MARGWLRRSRSSPEALDSSPARDDAALHAAVEDGRMGRWDGPRDLLAGTGADWDRRIFRLQVLARGGATLQWADTWAAAEPDSPHAVAALAHVQAVRALVTPGEAGAELGERAWRGCQEAAGLWPQDPSPFVVMLALTRVHFPDLGRLREVWSEVIARDPYNREAHHEVVAYFFPSGHGSTAEMYNWVYEAVNGLPHGSPLAALPLVAHAEFHRHRLERAGLAPSSATDHPWRDCSDIDRVLAGWWQARSAVPHANFMDDANHLAHALSFAGRDAEAAEVFAAIGPYAARMPWACTGKPAEGFLAARSRATAAAAANGPPG